MSRRCVAHGNITLAQLESHAKRNEIGASVRRFDQMYGCREAFFLMTACKEQGQAYGFSNLMVAKKPAGWYALKPV
jgi:hypothetical protein